MWCQCSGYLCCIICVLRVTGIYIFLKIKTKNNTGPTIESDKFLNGRQIKKIYALDDLHDGYLICG